MKRPITIASGQFGDLSLEELCKLVSSIGYEGIEVACQAHINVHKVLEDDAYVAQFRATLEKYGDVYKRQHHTHSTAPTAPHCSACAGYR